MTDIELRPLVRAFAEQMELALRRNDHKESWRGMHPDDWGDMTRLEFVELEDEVALAYQYDGHDHERVTHEAADLAVCAMFAADNYGNLNVAHDGRGRAIAGGEE